MTKFAYELAAQMSRIMDSAEHKSVFGTSPIGKFAAKKDDKKEDEEDKKEDKKDKKDEKDKKNDKKASIGALIELFARGSAALDDAKLVKSSLAAIKVLEIIASEMKEMEDKKDDKKDDKKGDKDKEDKEDKEEKKDKKDDDKSKADDSSYANDYSLTDCAYGDDVEPTDHMPKHDQKKTEEDMKKLDELGKNLQPMNGDGNAALDAEKMFEDVPEMGNESKPVELNAPSIPSVDSEELLAMLEAVGIKLTPDQEGKLSEMLEGGHEMKAHAMKIVGKLLASKFGA